MTAGLLISSSFAHLVLFGRRVHLLYLSARRVNSVRRRCANELYVMTSFVSRRGCYRAARLPTSSPCPPPLKSIASEIHISVVHNRPPCFQSRRGTSTVICRASALASAKAPLPLITGFPRCAPEPPRPDETLGGKKKKKKRKKSNGNECPSHCCRPATAHSCHLSLRGCTMRWKKRLTLSPSSSLEFDTYTCIKLAPQIACSASRNHERACCK